MKIEQAREIKSIESEFLKLSKSDKVRLRMTTRSSESFAVEMNLFDDDLGRVKVTVETLTQSHVENLQIVLEMLQGSI